MSQKFRPKLASAAIEHSATPPEDIPASDRSGRMSQEPPLESMMETVCRIRGVEERMGGVETSVVTMNTVLNTVKDIFCQVLKKNMRTGCVWAVSVVMKARIVVSPK